jgi:hypothetical protein
MANRFRDDNIEDSFVAELIGLPTRKKSAPKKRINIDPTSFAPAEDVGFFSTEKEKKIAAKGIKEPGAALAREFSGLRPKPKKITGLSTVSEEAKPQRGGFVSFTEGAKKELPQAVANFGLPTNRLPTIEELGGALGGIARYVSQLTKRNRARGLSPGTAITKTLDKGQVGLQKANLASLTKRLEIATLSGDKEKAAAIEARLDAIVQGRSAGAFEDEEDIEAIAGL